MREATERGARKLPVRGRWAEHRLQCACVRWFALQYPGLRGRLFAVPNGGRRDGTTGAMLKAEGVVAGVSDLVLLAMSRGRGALLLEMKTRTGRASQSQREWAASVTAGGEYEYAVCRSLDEFRAAVEGYLAAGEEEDVTGM